MHGQDAALLGLYDPRSHHRHTKDILHYVRVRGPAVRLFDAISAFNARSLNAYVVVISSAFERFANALQASQAPTRVYQCKYM